MHSAWWGSVELAVMRQIHTIYNRMFFICKHTEMDDFCSSVMFNTFNALSTEHLKIKVTKLWSWFEKSYPRDPLSWSSLVLKENLRLLRLTLFPLNISATARASSSTRNTIHGWKLHIVIFLSLCYVSSYTLGTTGCYWPACKSLKYTICCMSKFV